jgi:small subunit ribosomal protein S14
MKYLNKEDKKTREIVNKFFNLKVEIKQIKLLNKSNSELQNSLALKLLKLPRASGLTRPKNRCILSCKGRAVLRRFKVSHTTLREEYPKGVFPGLYKKSF